MNMTRQEALDKLGKLFGNGWHGHHTDFLDALEALGLIKFKQEKDIKHILIAKTVETYNMQMDKLFRGGLTTDGVNALIDHLKDNGYRIVKDDQTTGT